MMLAVRSGSFWSSRTLPVARSVPLAPWNSTCCKSTRFSDSAMRIDAVLQLHALLDDASRTVRRRSSMPDRFGFATMPAIVSLSAMRPPSR